eukprot:5945262-Amphidinium_carterae.1
MELSQDRPKVGIYTSKQKWTNRKASASKVWSRRSGLSMHVKLPSPPTRLLYSLWVFGEFDQIAAT